MNNISEDKKSNESVGKYIGNVVISMIFPFMVLWYGPKYLIKKMYIKGIIIIFLVVTEFILVGKWRGIF